jgi:septation ring formation regulator EzrA
LNAQEILEHGMTLLAILGGWFIAIRQFAHFRMPKVCETKFSNIAERLTGAETRLDKVEVDTGKLKTHYARIDERLNGAIDDLKEVTGDLKRFAGSLVVINEADEGKARPQAKKSKKKKARK